MPEKNRYPTVFGQTARTVLIAGLIFALTAGADAPGPAAGPLGQASDSVAGESAEAPKAASEQPQAQSDPAAMRRGRILFLQCTACHSLKEGEAHKVGPNLHRVIGAPAAHKPDYNYTDSLKDSGIVWSRQNLSRFLADPYELVPGTAMVFIGIERGADRAALIDYLEQETR
ncbi:MAG: c-type cytochrome [Gammaproteobacteria bacterium]|nr:c-type cytochrome [Gammaproteobacteria bacterium]MXZ28182.1 c-type cytochrome [Gammaproteobacteria bacterium]MYF57976.1 c-type cytochrome [Gammaproteobacteria bacterium]MYH33156.1 c-type cytochrome [Gammaproteobacteria bacterium]MYL02370.1 c-type cytochrome [Gammaproteobacteria bacterium]